MVVMECGVDGCDRLAVSRGWCTAHYMRWYKHGDPLGGGAMRPRRQALARQRCTVEDCDRPRGAADGLCKMHAIRRKRHGDPAVRKPGGKPPAGPCSIDGCTAKAAGLGLCRAHYYRHRRYGNAEATPVWGGDWRARFWSHVDRSESGCWAWDTEVDYPSFAYTTDSGAQRECGAHRLAYELEVGPIPDGLVLDHLCNNPRCVKPAHLEPVTQRENLERGWLRRLGLRVDLVP